MKKPILLNFDNYTFRASSNGKLMGEAKTKSDSQKIDSKQKEIDDLQEKMNLVAEDKREGKAYKNQQEKMLNLRSELLVLKENKKEDKIILPDTCTTYLREIFVQEKYGIKKDIFSKYFEKGKAMESEAIDLLSETHDKFYLKCELPRQKNEFIEGECDILYDENIWVQKNPGERFERLFRTILDIKNSWDLFTFYKNLDSDEMKKMYYWQGISYIKLYNADKFVLVFCLMNMPNGLIEDERKRILYQLGSDMEYSPIYEMACKEFLKKCTFDELQPNERIFDDLVILKDENFDIEYNKLVERIKVCRKWLNEYAVMDFIRTYGIDAYNTYCEENKILPIKSIEQEEETKFVALVEEPKTKFEKAIESVVVIEEISEVTQEEFDLLKKRNNKIEEVEIINTIVDKDIVLIKEEETEQSATIEETEPKLTSLKISQLKDEQSCIDLWKTADMQKLMKEFPELKIKLQDKRNSFKEPIIVEEEKPTVILEKEEKVDKSKIEKPKVEKPKIDKPTENPKIQQIKDIVIKCKNEIEVKNAYRNEKEFVNLTENRPLKRWIEQILDERTKNPIIESVEEVEDIEEDVSDLDISNM